MAKQKTPKPAASSHHKLKRNQKGSQKKSHTKRYKSLKNSLGTSKAYHVHQMSVHKLYKGCGVVKCLELSEKYFLLVRQDSSLEIWNAEGCIRRMPGRQHAMIRSACLVRVGASPAEASPLLLTVGLDSYIRLWDLSTFNIVSQLASNGGPIWDCTAISDSEVLVACDDGKARIFSIAPQSISLKSTFTPTIINNHAHDASSLTNSSRMHAVAYLRGQNKILCAGASGVYCYDLDSAILNFHIATNGMVWCLQPLDHDQFALGDSHGFVSICESTYGTVLHQFQKHKHDVMALHAYYEKSTHSRTRDLTLASVGIDGQLIVYGQISPTRWHLEISRRASVHDVHFVTTISAMPGVLLLGGVSTKLLMYPFKSLRRSTEAILHRHNIDTVAANVLCTAPKTGIVAMHNNKHSVYIMYTPVSSSAPSLKKNGVSRLYTPSFEYEPSVVLKITIQSEAGWNISSLSLSPSGRFLVVSTPDMIELIELKHDRETKECSIVSRINLRSKGLTPAYHVRFAREDLIVLAGRTNSIELFSLAKMDKISVALSTGHAYLTELQDTNNFFPASVDRSMSSLLEKSVQSIAANEQYLAVAYGNMIDIFDLSLVAKRQGAPYWTIPFPKSLIHTVRLQGDILYVMGDKSNIVKYSLKEKELVEEHNFFSQMKKASVHSQHPGIIKYVKEVQPDTYLLGTHKEFFAYKEGKLEHGVLANKQSNILALEDLGSRQLIVCSMYEKEQVYELPDVLYRKRFAAE